MSGVQRAILFSAAERYGSLALFVGATAVLSRLLTPHEFGIYAVVNALTAVLAAAFQEIGGANYLIQKRALTRSDIGTAFTVTCGLSLVAGTGLIALRDAAAWAFGEPALALAVTVAALNFAVMPVATTVSALFRRDMDFRRPAMCGLAGTFVGVVLAIALAAVHYSYMAPIWGTLAGNTVTALLLVAAWKDRRVFRPSLAGFSDVIGFGLYSSGVSLINVFYNLAPQLFLARILDFAAVGLYSRAVSVTQIFDKLVVQVLGPVVLPAIAAQAKKGGELKRIYLDAVTLLTAVQWPFLGFVAIMAHPIILVWMGPAWLDVVPLVRLLCIAYLALFAACLTYPMLVAAGHVRDALVSSLISLPPSLAIVLGAAFFGVEAVAAAALVTLPFQAAVAIRYVGRRIGMTGGDLLRAVTASVIVTLAAVAGPALCATLVAGGALGPIAGLAAAALSAAAGWGLGLAATGHPLRPHLAHAAQSLPFGTAPLFFLAPRRSAPSD